MTFDKALKTLRYTSAPSGQFKRGNSQYSNKQQSVNKLTTLDYMLCFFIYFYMLCIICSRHSLPAVEAAPGVQQLVRPVRGDSSQDP